MRYWKTCFNVVKANKENKLMLKQGKVSEDRATHLVKITAATKIRDMGLPLSAFNVKQLKALLVPLKREEEGSMSTLKIFLRI